LPEAVAADRRLLEMPQRRVLAYPQLALPQLTWRGQICFLCNQRYFLSVFIRE
jgi:hypothetical protein